MSYFSKKNFIFLTMMMICHYFFPQEANMELSSSTIFIGSRVSLVINVLGRDISTPPKFPDSPDYTITYRGQSSQRSISNINGQTSTRWILSFSYDFVALRDGLITLPDLPLNNNGILITIPGIPIQVLNAQPVDGFHLLLNSETPTVYQKEPVEIEVAFLFNANADDVRFSLPFLRDPRFDIKPLPANSTSSLYYFISGNHRFVATQKNIYYNNTTYRALTFRFNLQSKVIGTFSLDTAYVNFSSGFNQHSIPLEQPLSIEIKPLPEAMQNGKGLVVRENLSIQTTLTPHKVYIGDPMELEFTIDGAEHYEGDSLALLLAKNPSLEKDFVVTSGTVEDNLETGQQFIHYSLRAKSSHLTNFPSLEISWFDLSTGKVNIYKTNSLPLLIEKGNHLTGESFDSAKNMVSIERGFLTHLYYKEGIPSRNKKQGTVSLYFYSLLLINLVLFLVFLIKKMKFMSLYYQRVIACHLFQKKLKHNQIDSIFLPFKTWLESYIGKEERNRPLLEQYELLNKSFRLSPNQQTEIKHLFLYFEATKYRKSEATNSFESLKPSKLPMTLKRQLNAKPRDIK